MAGVTEVGGYAALVGAIFCWGTAFIFLKLRCVRQCKVGSLVLTLWYSVGYGCSGIIALLSLHVAGVETHFSWYGVLAGIMWGVGKVLSIQAVSSDVGLAVGQAVQCVVNLMTTFMVGVTTGEEVTLLQGAGLPLLLFGMLILSATRSHSIAELLGAVEAGEMDSAKLGSTLLSCGAEPASLEHATDAQQYRTKASEANMQTTKKNISSGILMAGAAGVCLGLQLLPFKYAAVDARSFSINGALGQFLLISIVVISQLVFGAAQCPIDTGSSLRVAFPACVMGGAMLFVAAACNTFAATRVGVVGTCLTSTNMIVAGVWGIFLFSEITHPRLISLFFAGAFVGLTGGILLAVF